MGEPYERYGKKVDEYKVLIATMHKRDRLEDLDTDGSEKIQESYAWAKFIWYSWA
jgi:hypothetical protein